MGGVAVGAWHIVPASVAAAVAMAFGLLVTGAFHEDGLGDIADAFGGGWTIERRLEILKDSRHGTYGVAAMCTSIVVRVIALGSMPGPAAMFASVVVAHTMGRVAAVGLGGTMRLGVYPCRLAPGTMGQRLYNEYLDQLVYADEIGFDSIWIPEAWGYEQFQLLTEIAVHTKRLRFGTGIANVFSRSAALLAMSALKFAIVVLFYMHLKYDHKLFKALFTGPLIVAMGTIVALLFLFAKLKV